MEYKDYYKILGVTKQSTDKEIKSAYRKLARQYHPDTNPNNPSAESKFKEINEAYEVLGDADKRKKYDMFGSNYQRWQQQGGMPGGFDFGSIFNGAAGAQGINLEDLESILGGMSGAAGAGGFSSFFESMFGGQGGGARTYAEPLRQDSEQEIEISLEEAYHGATRTLVAADGSRTSIKIPRGAYDGLKIRFRGKGANGGDLLLIIRERKHAMYERDGSDLRAHVSVDSLMATLGGSVEVNTLKGPVKLKIMPGTQGGRTLRLRGRGMPSHKSPETYGNMYVTVNIQVPTHLTDEERALYEQLQALQGNS